MPHLMIKRGLPMLLALMAVAVILILAGAGSAGLAFGLVVAGMAGVLLVSTVLHDVKHTDDRHRSRHRDLYRGPHVRGN
jgi:ABC-type transport system involved in cytochrome bd biosynthesis fused ATPase/permease subunit